MIFLRVLMMIIANTAVFVGWYLFFYKQLPRIGVLNKTILTSVFGVSQIILSTLILGLGGVLYDWSLLIATLIVSGVLMVFNWVPNQAWKEIWIRISSLWNQKHSKRFWVIVGLFVGASAWIVFLGILFPPHDWDGLSYHLGWVGYVLQTGAIQTFNSGLIWVDAYPKNIELYFLWNTIFLKNGLLVDLSQVIFGMMGIMSIVGIGRVLKLSSRAVLLAALMLFTTPAFFIQLKTTYVDVASAGLFLVAVYLVLLAYSYSKQQPNQVEVRNGINNSGDIVSLVRLLIAGAALSSGILFGTKQFSVILVGIVFIYAWILLRKQFVKLIPLFILLVALTGSFWYFKNLVIYHNPVYPFRIELSDRVIFPGTMGVAEFSEKAYGAWDGVVDKNFFEKLGFIWTEQCGWTRYNVLYTTDNPYAGLGPVWFIILFPALIIGAIKAFRERRFDIVGFLAVGIIAWLVTPSGWYTRYTMALVGFAGIAFAYLMTDAKPRIRSLLENFSIVLVVFTLFLMSSLGYFAPEIIKNQLRKNPWTDVGVGFRGGSFYDTLEKEVNSSDAVVVYGNHTDFIYPYWNKDFSNKVVHVPFIDYDNWLNQLIQVGATLIQTRSSAPEWEFIQKNPKSFSVIENDPNRDLILVRFNAFE